MAKPPIYYFGCIGDSGHYLWRNDYNRGLDFDVTPWGTDIDTGLCPPGNQPQGLAALHHKDGWTALAFWDRSVDKRPGSNSVFLANRVVDFDGMMALARANFPAVIARLPFPITDAASAPHAAESGK